MSVFNQAYNELSIIVASLCGALVWVMNQRNINPRKQPILFMISFVMGILGADLTIEVINKIVGCEFTGERAIGAFFCSALVVTLITNITCRIKRFKEKNKL